MADLAAFPTPRGAQVGHEDGPPRASPHPRCADRAVLDPFRGVAR